MTRKSSCLLRSLMPPLKAVELSSILTLQIPNFGNQQHWRRKWISLAVTSSVTTSLGNSILWSDNHQSSCHFLPYVYRFTIGILSKIFVLNLSHWAFTFRNNFFGYCFVLLFGCNIAEIIHMFLIWYLTFPSNFQVHQSIL